MVGGPLKQFAVSQRRPSALLHSLDFVAIQKPAQLPRKAFVEQDSHRNRALGGQKFRLCGLEHFDHLFPGNGRKIVEEFANIVPRFQVIQEVLHRHPCTTKNRGPAENFGIRYDDITFHKMVR